MAFGIDDALTTAAAGISLTDTCVKTIQAYRKRREHLDIERLIEEVRVIALHRIDDADIALMQLERTLVEQGIDIDRTLFDVIRETRFWRPFEAYRLKRIRQSFNALADATYSAIDDIASLVRCRNQTEDMGYAVIDSAKTKHEFQTRLLQAKSVRGAIELLRKQLAEQKDALQ